MRRWGWLIIPGILAAVTVIVAAATESGHILRRNAPEQPIHFPHVDHVSRDQIACEFCHRTARRSEFAGMPSTEFCMRCHRVVRTGSPEVRKLHGYWDRRQAVPWVRVYELPGFVFYSHEPHTVTAGIECRECHGDVKAMERIRQSSSLRMGWCLNCHRARGAPVDCWACHR